MPPLLFPALMAMSFALSWAITAAMRTYAIRRLLDIPNDRSSHTVATPRGGGIGIVISFALTLGLLSALGTLPWITAATYLVGGFAISAIGLIDDHFPLPAAIRLATHVAGAACALGFTGGIGRFLDPSAPLWLVATTTILALLTIVWVTNLTNFMDGIDGLAGAEACSVAAGAALLLASSDPRHSMILLTLAASSAGFLVLNWPPAKIFLGDAGSGFLGFVIGVLLVTSGPKCFFVVLILFGVFCIDSTVTLVRRILNRERWLEAHRTHAYQHAARIWGHRRVTIAVLAVNLLWLFPIAAGAAAGSDFRISIALVIISWTPLFFLAIRHRAGTR